MNTLPKGTIQTSQDGSCNGFIRAHRFTPGACLVFGSTSVPKRLWKKLTRCLRGNDGPQMAKAQISWKRRNEEGQRLEIYAHHVGDRWNFYIRERRVGEWKPLEQPPLEDYLQLLDGVRRRV